MLLQVENGYYWNEKFMTLKKQKQTVSQYV